METFLKICKKIKSGKDRGMVYGEFNKLYVYYFLTSYTVAKNNGINILT